MSERTKNCKNSLDFCLFSLDFLSKKPFFSKKWLFSTKMGLFGEKNVSHRGQKWPALRAKLACQKPHMPGVACVEKKILLLRTDATIED